MRVRIFDFRFATAVLILCIASACRADSAPSTQPGSSAQSGPVDFTFTERSPQSAASELARRLNLKPADTAADYDLSKCPFKAYVPTNYDPAAPVGLFVYLGYKDTVATPPLWTPLLEKYHLIFISPVCHSGQQFPPAVPFWQTLGLAFDAVHNLQRRYAIDNKRIYLMTWAKDATRVSFAAGDVFTGFVVVGDPIYCQLMYLPDGRFYNPGFASPPGDIFTRAKDRPFCFITDGSPEQSMTLKVATMKHDAFDHVMLISLSYGDDVHYPNLKADWFEQKVLPFLDKSATASAPEHAPAAASAPTTAPPDPAQHLLSMARIYLGNGQTDLARQKLQEILDHYPNCPADEEAKELIAQINGQ